MNGQTADARSVRLLGLLGTIAVTFVASVAIAWKLKIVATTPDLSFVFAYLLLLALLPIPPIVLVAALVMAVKHRRWSSLVLLGVAAAMVSGFLVGGSTGRGLPRGRCADGAGDARLSGAIPGQRQRCRNLPRRGQR